MRQHSVNLPLERACDPKTTLMIPEFSPARSIPQSRHSLTISTRNAMTGAQTNHHQSSLLECPDRAQRLLRGFLAVIPKLKLQASCQSSRVWWKSLMAKRDALAEPGNLLQPWM